MSETGKSEPKEEDEEDDNTISVRPITEEERHLLGNTSTSCNAGNTHIWKLEDIPVDFCSTFSEYQVKSVAIGGEHFLILTEDLKLYTFGSNSHGQLGQGDCEDRNEICFVSTLQDKSIKIIACGERHNAAVDESGLLYTWGDSKEGQCGLGADGIFTTPSKVCFPQLKRMSLKSNVPLEAFDTKIKAVSCGELFSVAIDTKGCVWSWGMGCGLGHGKDFEICMSPKLVKRLSHKKALMVACGSYHCIVLTQDDYVDSPFHVAVSPDYRTASVSSSLYSDLRSKSPTNSTQVPFLHSKVTNVETSSISSFKMSQSTSELPSTGPTTETEYSTSTSDLRSLGDTEGVLNQFNKLSLDGSQSAASSQYYSALDMKNSDKDIKIGSDISETVSQCSTETSHSSTGTLENTSADTLQHLSSETDSSGTGTNKQSLDDTSQPQNSLFEGKQSLFREEPDIDNPLQRTRSSAVSKRTLKPLEHLTSLDDSLNCPFDSSTQVWTFGKNSYGQLGHGDVDDRFVPTLVKKLRDKGIIKVSAGSYHSLVFNSQGKVYSCGDNAFGQLGHTKTTVLTPKKIKVLQGMRVWNFSAGRNFSVFLGDTERNKTNVYFCGDVHSERNAERKISELVAEVSHIDKKRGSSKWKLFKRNTDINAASNYVDIQLRKLNHFQDKEIIKCVIAKDFSLITLTNGFSTDKSFEPIYKFARAERLVYQQLMMIQRYVIEPFIKTDAWNNITKMVGGEAMPSLIDSFLDLLNAVSTELIHLTDIISLSLPIQDMFSYIFADSFRGVYERYAKCYTDALAVGHLQTSNKSCSTIISRKKEIMKSLEKELSLTQASFETLLKVPLVRAHVYCDLAKRISSHCKGPNESSQLKEVITRWLSFSDAVTARLAVANATNEFWNESHHKLIETLKNPQRRVLKSSKSDPLTLARASRLSSHSYILCNDVFVHVQYNRNFQVFPLVTLWADSEHDTDYLHNAIKITSPEESFVLVAGTPDGKLAWLKELNQAIATCLATFSRLQLDNASVNTSSGLLKAAVAREATYTYNNHLTYKNAVYQGMWMAGEPHGRGRLQWEEGTVYEGEFVKGRFEGYGQMTYPENTTNPVTKVYEGEWKDGKMNGYGKMSYGQNEEYVGHFKNNARHGHGTLKCSSSKNSLDTIYVGSWMNDVKSGYGVLDYIVRGEKYMGMWANDQRQGFGVVVTVDGVYYEGRFNQNKLAGRGILLNEDDTCYKGEFTADMMLSGKGLLTLPNGDFIDGSFFGKWGESIKVNGTFSKFSNPLKMPAMMPNSGTDDRLKSTDFTIDPNIKWESLFEECLSQLGCEENNYEIDVETAWKNVNDSILKAAGSLSGMYRNPTARMDIDFTRRNESVEYTKLATDLKALQEFLDHAFKTHGHPLHALVEGLSEVYRATYVGVGAHRRLLSHAVSEAKSYVTRLFQVLRILFPDLHDEEFVMLSNDTVDGYMDPPVNSVTLLHPLFLPRLYPPLFTLYALQTEKTDAVYTEKLHYLNKRGDMALLSFLGVKRDFWLLPNEVLSTDEEKSHKVYIDPIETLEQISTTYSPMGKIDVLRQTFAKINGEVKEHYKGVRKVLAMDDLFPLFQFIVIRARIPHLGSEIQFIEDLVEDSVLVGEAGHMVTTLSASYFQIQQERDRDM